MILKLNFTMCFSWSCHRKFSLRIFKEEKNGIVIDRNREIWGTFSVWNQIGLRFLGISMKNKTIRILKLILKRLPMFIGIFKIPFNFKSITQVKMFVWINISSKFIPLQILKMVQKISYIDQCRWNCCLKTHRSTYT